MSCPWFGGRLDRRPATLDVHVRWLRLKIEEDPAIPAYIQTVTPRLPLRRPEELE
jgi:DNA-binding response OmpR family regulator